MNALAKYAALLDEEFFDEPEVSPADELFDRIYPPTIRQLSWRHWTPVCVAVEAVKLLGLSAQTRLLDVGCGPGKFCLVAGALTAASITGIEQRSDLVEIARFAAAKHHLNNVEIIHGNVSDLSFADFDAFYLYNPFEENVYEGQKIDSTIPLSLNLLVRYTAYVAEQLQSKPIGTRVVTYGGEGCEIPPCFICRNTAFGGELKLWIKTREPRDEDFEIALHKTVPITGGASFDSKNPNL